MSKSRVRMTSLLLCMLLLGYSAVGCTGVSDTLAHKSNVRNADESIIDEEGMIGTIKELASEKYKGRMAGTAGNEAAAAYIADRFRDLGLENPEGLDDYMQLYPQAVITLKGAPSLSLLDENGEAVKEYDYAENYVLRSLSSFTDDIDITAPLYEVKDRMELAAGNKAVKGKMLLISWPQRSEIPLYYLIDLVNKCGAAGAIGEFDIKTSARSHGALTVTPMLGPWLSKEHSPFINVDNDTFAELLPAAGKGYKINYKCSFTRNDGKKVPNVIGLLPGTDKKLKDQYIIIGAHFDHVGDNMDGTYNPGGLDNASGTAAMLEIARVLKESKVAPKKPVLFIAFNGEEGGMLGSRYYAEHPVYPIDNSVMISLDMVGSSEKLPLMIVGAEGGKLDLRKEFYDYCQELGIDAQKGIDSASDHASFADKGIRSVLLINDDFFNGYHTPADTYEDVDKTRIEEVVKLVLHYIDNKAY